MLCDIFEKSRATLSLAAQLIVGISGTQMGQGDCAIFPGLVPWNSMVPEGDMNIYLEGMQKLSLSLLHEQDSLLKKSLFCLCRLWGSCLWVCSCNEVMCCLSTALTQNRVVARTIFPIQAWVRTKISFQQMKKRTLKIYLRITIHFPLLQY